MKDFLWLLILGISTMSGLTSCETDFDEAERETNTILLKTDDGNGDRGGNGGGD